MGFFDTAMNAAKAFDSQKKAEEARKKVEEQERLAASGVEIWFMENVPFEYEVVLPAVNAYGSAPYSVSDASREMIANLKKYTYEAGGDAVINVRVNRLTAPGRTNDEVIFISEAYGVAVKKK